MRDRIVKFAGGSVRLAVLLAVVTARETVVAALPRYVTFFVLGAGGALVNVNVIKSPAAKIVGFVLASALFLCDLRYDALVLVYVSKTLIPDALAGKIDTSFMKWTVAIVAVFAAAFTASGRMPPGLAVVWIQHALAQYVCEYGDNYLERYAFFRHRYTFDIACIAVYAALPVTTLPARLEMQLLQLDMTACLAYRMTNAWATLAHAASRKVV